LLVILSRLKWTQISDLEGQVNNLQDRITNLQEQKGDKNTQIDNLQSQLGSKNAQITSLQNQISEKDNQISNLQSQIEELEALVPPLRKGEWNLLLRHTDMGDYTTEYFYIPDMKDVELRINWTNYAYNRDEWIQWISLYLKGEEWRYESLLLPDKKRGTWLIHPPLKTGYNYLEIDTWIYQDSTWTVAVEVWIPE